MAYGTSSSTRNLNGAQTSKVNAFELGDDSYLDTHYKPIKLGGEVTPLELSSEGLITRGDNYIEGNVRCEKLESGIWNDIEYTRETHIYLNSITGGGFELETNYGQLNLYARELAHLVADGDIPCYVKFYANNLPVASPSHILTLINYFNSSSTMTGTGPAIKFEQAQYDFGGTGVAPRDTGLLGFYCQQNWTNTASTRDSIFKVKNCLDGSLQDCFSVSAQLHTLLYGDASIPATSKLLFDGSGSGHTYITESGDDILDFYVGTDKMLALDEANDKITMGATNWVAGTVSGGTVTEFSAANSSYAGMVLGYTRLQGDLSTQGTFEIQDAITVEDDTHKVTFKTPPSELVEIEATFTMNILTISTIITVGLSDANATDGYNSIGVEYEYDYLGITLSDGEADDGVFSCKWVLPAAELAAIGSSNTFWIGFGTAGSAKTVYLTYGVRATHGICTAPFVIKATALPATIYDGL